MPTAEVHCPECARTMQIDHEQLGAWIKCPTCKLAFEAEEAGGSYDLVDPLPEEKSSLRASDGAGSEFGGWEESAEELRRRMGD